MEDDIISTLYGLCKTKIHKLIKQIKQIQQTKGTYENIEQTNFNKMYIHPIPNHTNYLTPNHNHVHIYILTQITKTKLNSTTSNHTDTLTHFKDYNGYIG